MTFFNVPIYFINSKIKRTYIFHFYVSDRHLYNVIKKNIVVWLFIYFDFIWTKNVGVDHVIEKVACAIFNINFF